MKLQKKTLKHSLAQAKNAADANGEPCDPVLETSVAEMNGEMDYFSRSFDIKFYNNSMKIY